MNSMGGYAVLALYLLLTLLTSKSYATKVYYYDECTSLLENRVVNDSRPVNVYKYYTLRGSTDQYEVQLMRHGDRINQEINGCFMRFSRNRAVSGTYRMKYEVLPTKWNITDCSAILHTSSNGKPVTDYECIDSFPPAARIWASHKVDDDLTLEWEIVSLAEPVLVSYNEVNLTIRISLGYTAELTQSQVRGIGFVAGSILVVCVVCVVLGAVKNHVMRSFGLGGLLRGGRRDRDSTRGGGAGLGGLLAGGLIGSVLASQANQGGGGGGGMGRGPGFIPGGMGHQYPQQYNAYHPTYPPGPPSPQTSLHPGQYGPPAGSIPLSGHHSATSTYSSAPPSYQVATNQQSAGFHPQALPYGPPPTKHLYGPLPPDI